MTAYDVVIIGGGPGGYIAGERLGHAGRKVLIVEQESLGGTCLNVGCIPTKALLNSAKLYAHARESATFGVTAENVTYDWATMQGWKEKVVSTLVGGVAAMERRLGVEVVKAHATLLGPGRVQVDDQVHTSDHVIVATGSVPVMPPIPGASDNPAVVDSTGLLSIGSVPERLAVVGGGVIGIEFASLFAALGAKVDVVELLDEIVPFMDADLASRLRKGLSGVDVHLGCKVEAIEEGTVVYSTKAGEQHRLEADVVLMAVGRKPAVAGWGASESGLEHSGRGVVVDDRMRTNLPNVWAVGDVTGRSLLAHAAYRMGEIAAAQILDPVGASNRGEVMRWDTIPWAVYSLPEAAGVGLTEAQAKARGLDVITSTVPLQLSGRFVAEQGLKAPGTVKIVAERASRIVRGVHIVGPYAPETIWGATASLETELTIDDLRQVVFPHPTVSEGIREAVWAFKA